MGHFLSAWEAWHEARERRLRDPRGWLGITAIHWLTEAPQCFEDLPGAWSSHERCVEVSLSRGEALTVGSDVLGEGAHALGPLDEAGVTVTFGDAVA